MSRRPPPATAITAPTFRWWNVLRRYPLAAFALIGVGLGTMAFGALTSDQQFERGLESALAHTPAASVGSRMQASLANAPVSGSEAYWLAAPAGGLPVQPATWQGRGLTNGDQFLFGGGQSQRVLEVIDVRRLPAPLGASTGDKTPAALLLVSLRDVANPETTPVRMLVDADAPLAGLTPLARPNQRDL